MIDWLPLAADDEWEEDESALEDDEPDDDAPEDITDDMNASEGENEEGRPATGNSEEMDQPSPDATNVNDQKDAHFEYDDANNGNLLDKIDMPFEEATDE